MGHEFVQMVCGILGGKVAWRDLTGVCGPRQGWYWL